ncbi:MAG TPA: glycosyltransferase [Nakamurella sp.]|nr:glycosyltransferase [Nakamurella sp.]
MRIAVVTAHYPPNLVSGGTLIPQRIADELAARGHRVDVFTGAYDESEPDMWSWTETEDSGVRVHWVVTTGMLHWDSDENYANARMEAAFRRFLESTRPDVVHFHSMQGLGGGLLTIARAAGCPVVLTMHDMWWWCARQFLADRGLRPCCEVVQCGVCPCDRDNDWLVRRNRGLSAHLDAADLVLAPSATMVELLRANGVDPQRLELDENPALIPLPERPLRPERTAEDPVRFVYAGGTHPLKGAGVAMDAARLLAGLAGWQLDVYGMDLPPGMPAEVHSLPPYEPEQVGEVLAGYDVLLLPSVATESFSLITREALNSGTIVLTGDNPGPMEAVRHGENGLVVPRADAAALSAAMASLVRDRDLLERLRPAPGQIQMRTVAEQVDGLEQRYRRLLDLRAGSEGPAAEPAQLDGVSVPERPGGISVTEGPSGRSVTERPSGRSVTGRPGPAGDQTGSPSPIRRVLLLTGIGGAPLRYRGRLPQEALADLGVRMDVRMYRDIDAPALARTADAVVLYRCPATEQLLDLVDMVRARPEPIPVLYDVDDLVFDPEVRADLTDVLAHLDGPETELYWRGVSRYRTMLEASDAYIGSTEMLCDEVARLTGMPTHRFANGVGIELGRASDAYLRRPRESGPPRIGYLSGTSTHNEDWAFVEPAVLAVMRHRPDVQLTVGGLLETTPAMDEMAGRVTRLPMMPWYDLPGALRGLDVNLAPLSPGRRFNEAKSAIKWLEAALVAVPTVASSTQPFREAIVPGVTGMLASTVPEFTEAILALLDDGLERARMGAAARRSALLTLSPALQGRRYLEILRQAQRQVAEQGHRPQFGSGWEPVYDSEAYIPIAPEGYGRVPLPDVPQPVEPAPRSLRRIAQDYRTTAWQHLRAEGPVATARKTAQVLARIPARARARIG